MASWWSWDFGSNAFNSVMLSFVFSVYITGTVAANDERGQLVFSNAQTIAGIFVAVLAPLMGAWTDRMRNRRLMLAVTTCMVVACVAACWFVKPRDQYLFLGAGLIAAATMIQEIANVFYYGMLLQVSTPKNVGRVSGIGWGLGYFGGVLCLIVVLFGFILGGGLFGIPRAEATNARAVALFCAAWLLVFSVPVMIWGPPAAPRTSTERFNPLAAYRDIGRRLVRMWHHERGMLHFLVSSAVYRDGLSAVFAFAGVIAAISYGFSREEVIYFGLAANVIAAIGTWVLGFVDDVTGPRPVIVGALITMVALGIIIIVWPHKLVFWVAGLGISAMVGGVQSSSRTLLARIIPHGEEDQTFGLYQTVGRAVSFLAPALVGLFTAWMGVRWGIMGIVVTMLLGLLLFWPLRIPGITHGHVRR